MILTLPSDALFSAGEEPAEDVSLTDIELRLATLVDVPALHALIERSVRGLQTADYAPEQIDAALGTLLGVDTQLIRDGTYLVAEVNGQLAGCGGWSKRKTLFGSDGRSGREDALLDPARDAAKIRAFFIEPAWARQSIGSAILAACERAAVQAGFRCFEMGATLTGVPLYLARGYRVLDRIEAPLPNGLSLPIVRMAKEAVKEVS